MQCLPRSFPKVLSYSQPLAEIQPSASSSPPSEARRGGRERLSAAEGGLNSVPPPPTSEVPAKCVSILVFVDGGLERGSVSRGAEAGHVSMLIFVDDGLELGGGEPPVAGESISNHTAKDQCRGE